VCDKVRLWGPLYRCTFARCCPDSFTSLRQGAAKCTHVLPTSASHQCLPNNTNKGKGAVQPVQWGALDTLLSLTSVSIHLT
jgi:hypothetical protein